MHVHYYVSVCSMCDGVCVCRYPPSILLLSTVSKIVSCMDDGSPMPPAGYN